MAIYGRCCLGGGLFVTSSLLRNFSACMLEQCHECTVVVWRCIFFLVCHKQFHYKNHNLSQNSYYNGPRTLLGSKAECSSNYKHTRVCKSETNTLKLRTCGWLIIDNYLSMARSNTVHNNCCDINSTHTIASVKATGHCHTSN
jgi:hypothetical protein